MCILLNKMRPYKIVIYFRPIMLENWPVFYLNLYLKKYLIAICIIDQSLWLIYYRRQHLNIDSSDGFECKKITKPILNKYYEQANFMLSIY